MKVHSILKKVLKLFMVLIKLAIFIGLVATIVYLLKSENGLLAKNKKSIAQEKLDAAMKTFAADDNLSLEAALRQIEGLESLDIDEESGTYNMKIDGQDFLVVSQEVIPDDQKEDNEDGGENSEEPEREVKAEAKIEL